MIFEARQRLDAPLDVIWRHLPDPALNQEWMPGIENMRTPDGTALSANARLLFSARGSDKGN